MIMLASDIMEVIGNENAIIASINTGGTVTGTGITIEEDIMRTTMMTIRGG